MILTVTLNAAIDQTYRLERLYAGEVNRVARVIPSAGGKGLNVARVVHSLGAEVRATGVLGGRNGDRIRDLLEQEHIPNDFFDAPIESRICINIIDGDGTSTELLEPGDEVDNRTVEGFIGHFKELLKDARVVTLSGSGLRGMPDNMYALLAEAAHEAGKPVILDSSGRWLTEGLKAAPTVIKPNRDELVQLAGMELDEPGVVRFCQNYIRAGIRHAVVSLGSEGAILVSREGSYHARPPKLSTVNTVGSGDAMVAGLAVGLMNGSAPEELLRRAVAVSAANTLTEQTGFVVEEEAGRLYQEIRVERLGH